MTQLHETSKVVRIPKGAQLTSAVTVVGAVAWVKRPDVEVAGDVQKMTVAEAVTSARDADAAVEDAYMAMVWETFADDWDTDRDAAYNQLVEDDGLP